MENPFTHTSVLLHEAVDALLPADAPADGLWVDATFGRGGHARRLLQLLPAQARLLAFDKDPQAVQAARAIADARFSIRHQSFAALAELPAASVQGILLDLGVSSPQLDEAARGFSFRLGGPLDMRMDTTRGQTLAQWLASAPQEEMARVIRDYGEERFACAVARAIGTWRDGGADMARASTDELAAVVARAVRTRGPREAGQHPATRTFQALRIFINGELDDLQQALDASLRVLAAGGRLAVISFHSLEDRIVKQFINRHARAAYDRRQPGGGAAAPPLLQSLARMRPAAGEIAANPRARSAILRVARRTAQPAAGNAP